MGIPVMNACSLARSLNGFYLRRIRPILCVCVCVLGSCDMNTVGGDVMETVLAWEHLVYENSTEHIV